MGLPICVWPFCVCAALQVTFGVFAHVVFHYLFQRDLVIHLQKIILTSQNSMEDCADGWLKNGCSAPSLLGRFIGVLLASKTQVFFSRSKIYDSSCLFKFTQSFWSSSNPKFSDSKQNTGIGLFRFISSRRV